MKTKSILTIAIVLIASMDIINAQTTGIFTDSRDGKTYKTVKIGEQVWMAENLAYLPKVSKSIKEDGYWVYDYSGNDVAEAKATENYAKYGVLYNYKVSETVCPAGWKLPTKKDFEILVANFKGNKEAYIALLEDGSSGFDANLGGNRTNKMMLPYQGKDKASIFMTSTPKFGTVSALFLAQKKAKMGTIFRVFGISVRCIKK